MFATSEEQLVMHNEGKKHKRTVALKELTHGHLPTGPGDSITGISLPHLACAAASRPEATSQHGEVLLESKICICHYVDYTS